MAAGYQYYVTPDGTREDGMTHYQVYLAHHAAVLSILLKDINNILSNIKMQILSFQIGIVPLK